MKKISILLLALISAALLTGCGGPKKISASDAADEISKYILVELDKEDLALKPDGKATLTKESQKKLAEAQKTLVESGSAKDYSVTLEVIMPMITTIPTYELVDAKSVLTDADAFDEAHMLVRKYRLNAYHAPQEPIFVKITSPSGLKGKLINTVSVDLKVNLTDKRVVISDMELDDIDMEGYNEDSILVDSPRLVVVGSEDATFALQARTSYINEVNAKVKEIEEQAAAQKKAAEELAAAKKQEQEERTAAMNAAVAKAVEGFNGRYNVQLTQRRDGAVINLTFYFSVNENGEKVANFSTVGDARDLERSFKVAINERRAQKSFTEDGVARAAVEAKASAQRTGYNARDARDYPAFFRSGGFSLEMTSDTGNPGLLKISGSFEGVAKRAE